MIDVHAQVNKIFFLQSQDFIGENSNPDTSVTRLATNTRRVDKRLLAIPLLYIILRMWGTLQFFYSLAVAGTQKGTGQPGCIPPIVQVGYFIFGLLQVLKLAKLITPLICIPS